MKKIIIWLPVLLMAMLPAFAHAGVFKCVTSAGKTSYSQKPCPDASITGHSPVHELWRTLRDLVVEGKRLSNNLQGDVESIRYCQEAGATYRQKLDDLKPQAQSAALKHPHVFRAHELLYDCGQCRFSALSYCEKANVELDEAMSKL